MHFIIIIVLSLGCGLIATSIDHDPVRRVEIAVAALGLAAAASLAALSWVVALAAIGGLAGGLWIPPVVRGVRRDRYVTCNLPRPGLLPLRTDF